MYKPIEFQSFSELVHDFVLNYEKLYHKVTKIKARPRLPCRRICAGTGLTPATSAPGLGSPLPHLRRDWAHPAHICSSAGAGRACRAQ